MPMPDISQLLKLLSQANNGDAGKAGAGAGAGTLRWIRANRGEVTHQIPVDEVLFFQSDDKYTVVQTAGGEHLITKPLSELLRTLDGDQFWQIHRGTVVNLRFVTSTRREGDSRMSVNLKGYAKPLVVSRAYHHLFKHM
jgi:DNA-binding LytR/AlgR family response regulator